MKILIVPGGKDSAQMRGVQIGAALGARVSFRPSATTIAWADLVICVKRSLFEFGDLVRRIGRPLVWDAVDFWEQPAQNGLTEAEARGLLQEQIDRYQPTLVIGATQAMAEAASGAYLPHQTWPGLTAGPLRDAVAVVGYQGTRKYLGAWGSFLEHECRRRGWRFVVNPADIREADLLVALRDGVWDGWICREWKSGVKIGNAMAAGRPILTQPSAAFRELAPIGCAVTDESELVAALDRYSDQAIRQSALVQPRADALHVDRVAARYRRILMDIRQQAA